MAKKYFLAANSCEGFVSYFNTAYDPYKGWHAYIIKGGPGTGKSTFMKKITEIGKEKGYDAELCPCSSDPNSLDAVIFPKLKVAVMDGTAPHTVDPIYPAAVDTILNFGDFWNIEPIKLKTKEIIQLTDKNRTLHKTASAYLKSAGCLIRDSYNTALKATNLEKTVGFAKKLTLKYFKKQGSGAEEKIRFLTGTSPDGIVSFTETVNAFADKEIIIKDDYGSVSNSIMQKIRSDALEKGYKIFSFKNPFLPELLDHIIIPELRLAFLRESKEFVLKSETRRIHAGRFINDDKLKTKRLKYNYKTANELLNSAVLTLKKAKKVHDKLESCYVSAMNFNALEEFALKFADSIF